jgi:hypothetical protein
MRLRSALAASGKLRCSEQNGIPVVSSGAKALNEALNEWGAKIAPADLTAAKGDLTPSPPVKACGNH